ncbi:hypothetical protein WJ81_15705 [Burkholderia ubonensis]|nr:hypothetical protein WJ81_15705 [Burkholderia ubonensis]
MQEDEKPMAQPGQGMASLTEYLRQGGPDVLQGKSVGVEEAIDAAEQLIADLKKDPGKSEHAENPPRAATNQDRFDRLLALLDELLALLGESARQRTKQGAEASIVAEARTAAAADNRVKGALDNLAGAITGASITGVVAGASAFKTVKANQQRINSDKANLDAADQLQRRANSIGADVDSTDAGRGVRNANGQDQVRHLATEQQQLAVERGSDGLHLGERGVLADSARALQERAHRFSMQANENAIKAQNDQAVAQGMMSVAQPVGNIAQAGANVAAAGHEGQAGIENTASAIAQSQQAMMQQAANRTEELIRSLLSKLEGLMANRLNTAQGFLKA